MIACTYPPLIGPIYYFILCCIWQNFIDTDCVMRNFFFFFLREKKWRCLWLYLTPGQGARWQPIEYGAFRTRNYLYQPVWGVNPTKDAHQTKAYWQRDSNLGGLDEAFEPYQLSQALIGSHSVYLNTLLAYFLTPVKYGDNRLEYKISIIY